MLTLRQTTVIIVDLSLSRGARRARLLVIRVAHPRGGELGEQHFPHRSRLRRQIRRQRGHGVTTLLAGGQPAFAGPFGVVGFGPVLIEQKQPQLGGVLEFFGTHPDRDPHQIGLELLRGGGIDKPGQPVHRIAQHLDVLTIEQPRRLRGSHRRQHRGQGFTTQRAPRPQLGGLTQPPTGFSSGQPPPRPQHLIPRLGTQLPRCGLDLQLRQQPMPHSRQPTQQGFVLIEHRQQLSPRQRTEITRRERIERSA
nr:hypothetical protein CPGR_00947 [Mycolicibacterium fortuitum subsp. fortuitum DSM 46621 = ATCC 6841 = JCM 6387]